jgi:uncharacterized OB-fold protein
MPATNNLNPTLRNRPLPTVIEDSAEFWKSAKERRLKLQRCDECGYWRYYPSPVCHSCGSFAYQWTPISGRGTIWTYTVLHRARGNTFQDDVPLALALVELEEGAIIMSNVVDCQPEDLAIGRPVTIDYGDIDDDVTLPLFRLAA